MNKLLRLYADERNRRTIEWHIRYESSSEVSTRHWCDCGRRDCRRIMCLLCWREALAELEAK